MMLLNDITSTCGNPALARPLTIIHRIFEILCIVVPISLIVFAVVALIGLISDPNKKKGVDSLFFKFLSAVVVFFVPSLVNIVMNWVIVANVQNTGSNAFQIARCWKLAEETNQKIKDATYLSGSLVKGKGLSFLSSDLSGLRDYVYHDNEVGGASSGNNTGDNAGSSSNGSADSCVGGNATSSQPDPAIAINYWSRNGNINKNNFIYPKDTGTQYNLGAHPKNFKYVNISSKKSYQGVLMWPVTPENGVYKHVYEHNGMDILAPIGTPIYSPVDGTIRYSEWGHTVNKGCDETAYSVTIKLNNPISFSGKTLTYVFLTHMSGLIYYCPDSSCNRSVKRGELLGFVGNACGDSSDPCYAPHLHITYYGGDYNNGLGTGQMESLYNISDGVARKAGE